MKLKEAKRIVAIYELKKEIKYFKRLKKCNHQWASNSRELDEPRCCNCHLFKYFDIENYIDSNLYSLISKLRRIEK